MNSKQLKRIAKSNLENKWGIAIGVLLLFMLISSAGSSAYIIGTIFVSLPLEVGYVRFNYMLSKKEEDLGDLFYSFKSDFMGHVGTMALYFLYIFLWSLLLIIPGIVKAYSYFLTPYLLMDEDFNYKGNEAIEASRRMMNGHKARLFFLQLSFFGWIILTILSFGILGIYLYPYMYQTQMQFYLDLKKEYVKNPLPEEDLYVQQEQKVTSNEWDF